jgi:hypothetical protein
VPEAVTTMSATDVPPTAEPDDAFERLDRDVAAAHIHAMHAGNDGAIFFVGEADAARSYTYPDGIEAALDEADRVTRLSRECFVTPAAYTNTPGVERKKKYVHGSRVLWLDHDKGWDDEREAAYEDLRSDLGGNAIFRVKSSPGKYHIYIQLSTLATPEQVERANKALVAAFDGDPAPTGGQSWMRLAGTVHRKADPFRVTFVEEPRT